MILRLPHLVEFQHVLPVSVVPIDVTRRFVMVRQLLTPADPDAVGATIAALPLLVCALPLLVRAPRWARGTPRRRA
jgi:hypothetical protein